MFRKLRFSLRRKRNSDRLAWKLLFCAKDNLLKWKKASKERINKFARLVRKSIYRYLKRSYFNLQCMIHYHFKNNPSLKRLIKGKKILIVGCGASARELDEVPRDAKVFTCKAGLKLFLDKKFDQVIDLYLFEKMRDEKTITITENKHSEKKIVFAKNKFTEELFGKVKIKLFVTKNINYVRRKKEWEKVYSELLYDAGENNYFLKTLIKPYRIKEIVGNSTNPCTSSGMRLLQYALYFGAKEVYLIGIDFGKGGFFWGGTSNYIVTGHSAIDENFIKIVSKKHHNIYSLSEKSPIAKYIPCKKMRDLN